MKKKKYKSDFIEIIHLNKRAMAIWIKNCPQVFVSSAVYSVFSALIPYVGIYLSAQIINELAGNRNAQVLIKLVVFTLISTSLLTLINFVMKRWKNYAHGCIKYDKQKIFSDKLLSMDFATIASPHTYELLAKIQQNENFAGWGLGKLINNYEKLIESIIGICAAVTLSISLFTRRVPEYSTFVFLNSPIFAIVIVGIMLIITMFSPFLSNKANSYWASCARKAGIANRMFGFYGFLAYEHERALDIRIYRQDLICSKSYKESNAFNPRGEIARCARGYMGILLAASVAVSYVFSAIVYIYVCIKSWAGAFGVGSVTQYIGTITSLSNGFSALISTWGDMCNNAEFLHTTFEFLDLPSSMQNGTLHLRTENVDKFEFEFQDVSFQYPMSDTWALRHVNFKIKEGQKLAIVGENGSGKTTFIKLLCRLYDPTEGVIYFNGIDIRQYNYREYMNFISIVFQDFKLLAFQLSNNVAASINPDAIKVQKALQNAGMDKKVSELPYGIDTYLYKEFDERGVDVSGGEAQKIAIARALYKDTSLIILDEPTASLDPIAENEIYIKFNEIIGGNAAIFISHRLSSCNFSDKIIVFKDGYIVQSGSPSELISDKAGKYYELWSAQAKYYVKDTSENCIL